MTSLKKREIEVLLMRKNIITRLLEDIEIREIRPDRLLSVLKAKGLKVEETLEHKKNRAILVNEDVSFYRPGTRKPRKGGMQWQITFRGAFFQHLERGIGNLLVNRNGILLIPLSRIKNMLEGSDVFDQPTVDMWVIFDEGHAYLEYQDVRIEVTEYKIFEAS